MSYLYVKWNSFGCGSPANDLAIKAHVLLRGHSRNGGLRRRRRRVCAAVEGVACGLLGNFETIVSPLLTASRRSVCSTWMPVGRENSYAG
jgi:hypothetical protein